MSIFKDITDSAADLIVEHGWVRESFGNRSEGFCLHGAVKACSPKAGDVGIVRTVLRRKGFTEFWNDKTADGAEVVSVLRGFDVSDADLEETFGPQWSGIVDFLRTAASLTGEQAGVVKTARKAVRRAAWDAALDAAWDTAWDAAWEAVREAALGTEWDTAWGAYLALYVRHLISDEGFTQEHYDVLTMPFRKAGIVVHPGDKDIRA